MIEQSVGISLLLPHGTGEDPALAEPMLDVIESAVWTRPLRHFGSQTDPTKDLPRRPGVIRKLELRMALRDQLTHPHVERVYVTSAPPTRSGKEYGSLSVETRALFGEPFVTVTARQWLFDSATGDAWVAAIMTMAAAVGTEHGVVSVMESGAVFSDCELFELVRDGVLQHPFPDQLHRMLGGVKRELGAKYVRFPRWGTIYARHHVDALGGVDRIRGTVQPAIVRELGPKAWYFQLTANVATAASAEALEKQRRFTEIAEPLLPPSRSSLG